MENNSKPSSTPSAVSGREAIRAAYQEDTRADDYISTRYENDPMGRANHDHQVRVLRRLVSQHGIKQLLEVATGPARLTVHLPRLELGVGVEQSPAMIRVAQERLKSFGRDDWRVEQGDAFHLPYQSREFDATISFKLVRHFDRPDRILLLQSMQRAVRPRGHVILDVANDVAYRWLYAKWGLEKGWIADYWLTPDDFRQEAREAGFGRVRLIPIQPSISLQYYCWAHLHRVSPLLASGVGRVLEHWPVGQPLEWIAVCECV